MPIPRPLKDFLARSIARLLPARIMRDKRYYQLWEERGWHATPVHFYEPLPNIRDLGERPWMKRSTLPGIDLRDTDQLRLLAEFVDSYRAEYEKFPVDRPAEPGRFYLGQDNFRSADAEILYCMIRKMKPRRIIEIGSGFTTLLSAQALEMNRKQDSIESELTAIEPFPDPEMKPSLTAVARLIERPVQQVPLAEFEALVAGDILFIDSSHVVAIGSDVLYEILEILPRLKKGVIVHFHDIFLPEEYPRTWVLRDYKFWSEQYLLQAFLALNESFEVLWAGSHMHLAHPKELETAFPSYKPRAAWPGSFWVRRVK